MRVIYVIAILAALVGGGLIAHTLIQKKRHVTVSFTTAEGLVPGITKVRYRDVDIGIVTGVRLSRDRRFVLADLQLASGKGPFARCDSRFWVVRPRVGASGVSGLQTLVSGTFVEADLGTGANECTRFIGLETVSMVALNRKGKKFRLHSESRGSLRIGSPVFYRHVEAGQVLDYSLASDGSEVDVDVFITAPYDRYVNRTTRWWQASGIDVQLGSSGMKMSIQSLESVLEGGVVFDTVGSESPAPIASEGTSFTLAASLEDATRPHDDTVAAPLQMRFNESVRGLAVGAPVDFRGIVVGYVSSIEGDLDPSRNQFSIAVNINLYTDRLGSQYGHALGQGRGPGGWALFQKLIAEGLRAQLRMGSALTGQRYIALDFFPHAPAFAFDSHHQPVELPTEPGTVDALRDELARIAKRLNAVPFDQIGTSINQTLRDANALFEQLDTNLAPEAHSTLSAAQQTFEAANAILQQESPLQSDIDRALTELRRTLASLNSLSDYVERHPGSAVWGKASAR
jgi:paraquat-inducible protein B